MGRVFPSHDLLGRIGRLRSGPGEIGGGVKGFPKTYIIIGQTHGFIVRVELFDIRFPSSSDVFR